MKRRISLRLPTLVFLSILILFLTSCERPLLHPYFEETSSSFATEEGSETESLPDSFPSDEHSEEETVQLYATPKGKKYHFRATCGGENSVEISWEEAQERGLEGCKNCTGS